MPSRPTQVKLTKVRLSYPHLFVPSAMQQGQEEKYSASFIIPKKDKKQVERINAAIEAALQQGLERDKKAFSRSNIKKPLRDGDADRPDDSAYQESWFINANSKKKPQVVDRNVEFITDPEEVYAGCYVNATVNFYPFNTNGNVGIAAGLGNVQFYKDGDRLDGSTTADVDFSVIEDDDDDDEDIFS